MKIKKIKRRAKTWFYPSAVEREYVRALEAITDNVTGEVERFCKKMQKNDRLFGREDDFTGWLEAALSELLSAMLFFVSDSQIQQMVGNLLGEANRFNKRQFQQTLKKAYGVDIFTAEPWLAEQLKLFELQNINLIKSIPAQLHEKLRYKFIEAVQKGKRWEVVAEEIQALTGASQKRARLIARDQIGKLNAQLTQLRQQQIGVKSYIWRTSLDERVRKLHVGREGEQFNWDNPPDDGHPGEAINCRCYAEAVLPELEELVEQKGVIAYARKSRSLIPTELYSSQKLNNLYNQMNNIEQLREQAIKVEPQITSDIKNVILSSGGKMAGLEYRLKSAESLKRKIQSEMLAGISEQVAIRNVKDVIRYTAIFEPNSFVAQYHQMQLQLEKLGYTTINVKNSWKSGAAYKGINTFVNAIVQKDNVIFEIQYHTQQSFDLKNGELHKLYEEFRDPATPLSEKEKLYAKMISLSENLVTPKDIQNIKGVK